MPAQCSNRNIHRQLKPSNSYVACVLMTLRRLWKCGEAELKGTQKLDHFFHRGDSGVLGMAGAMWHLGKYMWSTVTNSDPRGRVTELQGKEASHKWSEY